VYKSLQSNQIYWWHRKIIRCSA